MDQQASAGNEELVELISTKCVRCKKWELADDVRIIHDGYICGRCYDLEQDEEDV